MKNNIIISIVGIDGSGKTTVANKIADKLNKEKKETFIYKHCRLELIISKPIVLFAKLFFLKNKNENCIEYRQHKKELILKYPILSYLYLILILLDYYLQIFVKLYIPLFLGKSVICDRYIIDTLATDIAIDFSSNEFFLKKLYNILLRFFPKPKIVIFLDIPEEVAFARKDDIPDLEYLKERRSIYLNISKWVQNSVVVNADKSQLELLKEVENVIKKVMDNSFRV